MNNLQYICNNHPELVGSLLEDIASSVPSEAIDTTLSLAEIPESALEGIERMESWLDSERLPGAWEPNECKGNIESDMETLAKSGNVRDYLAKRGIGYDDLEEAGAFAALDIALRWQKLYLSAVGGAIFNINYRRRRQKELEHDEH